MDVAGIHTQVKAGRAVVSVVILRRTADGWVLHRNFTHTANQQEELPQQVMNLAQDLPHRLDGLQLEAAVLRDRDRSPGGVNAQQLKVDHTADGVVLAELRNRCRRTEMLPGNRIGELCGSNKQTAENQAADQFGGEYRQAGAAAWAAAALTDG